MSSAHALRRGIVLGSLILAIVFAAGCQDDNDSTGSGPSSYSFSVHFTSGYPPTNSIVWVVLHTVAGDSAIAVRRVPQDGIVDFGYIGSDRVSFTIARITSEEEGWVPVWLVSFMGVPAGAWTLDWGPDVVDTLGYADVTVTFPRGLYDEGLLSLPDLSSWFSLTGDSVSQVQWTGGIRWLEDNNKLSLFALVSGPSGSHCGWAVNQTFAPGDTNFYSLQLDQPVLTQTITFNRPLYRIDLDAYRGPSWSSYYHYSQYWGADSTQFAVQYSLFPASKWSLAGSGAATEEHFYFDFILSGIPFSLDIPEYGLSATYNGSVQRFQDITVGGPADDLLAFWGSSDWSSGWIVFACGQAESLGLPTVPDSVLAGLTLDPSILEYPSITMHDWDTANSLDDAIGILFRSSAPYPSLYTTYYAVDKDMSPVTTASRHPRDLRGRISLPLGSSPIHTGRFPGVR